ncbi:MAG TPA: hypothetical protein VEB63_04775 [Chitinophagaceae bacterium]|nr:hypothetical protein [Chitinophagaceae bacterium]
MSWNSILGFVATIALFFPIIFILALRLSRYRTFLALLLYYSLVLAYNLLSQGYIHAGPEVIRGWGIGNNLLDAPLLLIALTYYSPSNRLTTRMHLLVLLVLLFEMVVILLNGFSVKAITVVMAPNLAMILCFCFSFFIRQVRITVMHSKALGKSLMISSLLFAYGCYSLIYLMYYVFRTPHKEDTFLVYFLVTIFSSCLMAAGILVESKWIRKLEEARIARRELLQIYQDRARPVVLRQPIAQGELD